MKKFLRTLFAVLAISGGGLGVVISINLVVNVNIQTFGDLNISRG